MGKNDRQDENKKVEQLQAFERENEGKEMTTNEGVNVSNDEESLKAGERGPTLIEDFWFREKLMHFDHERIPERVVHARGYGAHGIFKVYESQAALTRAQFLQDPSVETPVFVRFSEVAGSKGANDTNRDVRGFATKFYTDEGNFDLVGNNIPIFFIQDSMKFPDLIHAVKPEPHNEIPQGATAHDTFWDFISSNQESAAMMMWIMSDRTIPRSFRMMEGFGVHTFRLVNKEGKSSFVKFHWKPLLGVHSFVWDESHKLGGIDPDFHRRDLWNTINDGGVVEYELGIQVLNEQDEFSLGFDILDATKLWPEEDIPVRRIGKMTLNRNVENVFAETEQIALHPGNIVPGIDFSNDPLLQGRLFSYLDTQMGRLGVNFQQLPINLPVCPFHNNQRDGKSRYIIDTGKVAYHKNALANNTPYTVPASQGGFSTYPSTVEGRKTRKTAESFNDHFSQARLFWNSLSSWERDHVAEAFSFELGKVKDTSIRQRVINMIGSISTELAEVVAVQVGVGGPDTTESTVTKKSDALSMAHPINTPQSLTVGVLINDGFNENTVAPILEAFKEAGLKPVLISEHQGTVRAENGAEWTVQESYLTSSPLLYDGVYVAAGTDLNRYEIERIQSFVREQFMHYKPIGISAEAESIIQPLEIEDQPGVITANKSTNFASDFIQAMTERRFWERAK